ncbi:MAG: hypothetical protein N3B21_00320 [Clostridia bacterium]|nr:hypothetical protein [Clostridia bacterium]
MDNSIKAIIIGASVVICLVIVSIGFLVLRQGQDTAKVAVNKIDQMNGDLKDSDKTMYDGLEVSGSEVVNALNKFKKENIGIQVKTSKDASGTWYIYNVTLASDIGNLAAAAPLNLTDALNETHNRYINPNGRFTGKVYRNENGVITAISFTQK